MDEEEPAEAEPPTLPDQDPKLPFTEGTLSLLALASKLHSFVATIVAVGGFILAMSQLLSGAVLTGLAALLGTFVGVISLLSMGAIMRVLLVLERRTRPPRTSPAPSPADNA